MYFTVAERHKAGLINSLCIIILVLASLIGILNVLVFQAYQLAAFNFVSGALGGAIFLYFKRTANTNRAAWLLSLVVIFNVLAFIYLVRGNSYSLLWVTVIPPIVFFLLGRTAGAWVSGLVFVLVITFMVWVMPTLEPWSFNLASLLNMTEVFLVHWFMFRYYERSRAEAYAELEKLSVTDKLTGLYNRAKLDNLLAQEISRCGRTGEVFAVALGDIDYFKTVNDQCGHLVGDDVLKKVAEELKKNVRETDFVGRWGGEEFMIICPDTDKKGAATLMNQLRQSIEAIQIQDVDKPLTISFGVAEGAGHQNITEIVGRADDALYEAKSSGRNRVVVSGQ